jgi:hypothetical protein
MGLGVEEVNGTEGQLSLTNYTNNPLFSFTHSWKNPNFKNKKVGKNKKKHVIKK